METSRHSRWARPRTRGPGATGSEPWSASWASSDSSPPSSSGVPALGRHPGQGDDADHRGIPGGRLAQPVPRGASASPRPSAAPNVRLPHQLRPEDRQDHPGARRVVADRPPDKLTWTYTIRTTQVVRREAGHRRGRRLDLQHDDDGRERRHRQRQLHRELREGHRPRRAHRRHRAEEAAGHHAGARRADPAEARLGEGRRLLEVQQRQAVPDRRQRPVDPHRYEVEQLDHARAQQGFWRGAPKFDELVFRYIDDGDARSRPSQGRRGLLRRGLTPAQATALKSVDNINVNEAKGKRFQAITINPGARLQDGTEFGDGNKALKTRSCARRSCAPSTARPSTRRPTAATVEAKGLHPVALQGLPLGAQRRAEEIDFDLAKANQLLDSAGYTKGGNGIRAKGGKAVASASTCTPTDPSTSRPPR